MPARQLARCARCGHVAPLRAFEVEVALSADDSGDNDWVINYTCPACEAADRPLVLGRDGAAAPPPAPAAGPPGGPRANAIYDPKMP
jgi:hypothetical protein